MRKLSSRYEKTCTSGVDKAVPRDLEARNVVSGTWKYLMQRK